MKKLLAVFLAVFFLGGCTMMGKLSQVVGGAYTKAGDVLIESGKEKEQSAPASNEEVKPAVTSEPTKSTTAAESTKSSVAKKATKNQPVTQQGK